MIKKIITTTLIAASAAMANAETTETTWTSTQAGSTGYDQATSAGFVFNLNSTRLNTISNPTGISLADIVALDSINMKWTTSTTGLNSNVGFVLTDTSNNILAVSDTTSNVARNGSVNINFGGTQISSSTDYRVWFTGSNSEPTDPTTLIIGEVLSVKRDDVGIKLADYGSNTPNTGLEIIRYTGGGMWDLKYAPVVTFNTSAIPEPSMFGLLAGLGALALVGARRRRK